MSEYLFSDEIFNLPKDRIYKDFIYRKGYVPHGIMRNLDRIYSEKGIEVYKERNDFLKQLEKEDKELAVKIRHCRKMERVTVRQVLNLGFNLEWSLAATWCLEHEEYTNLINWDFVDSEDNKEEFEYLNFDDLNKIFGNETYNCFY